MCFVYPGVFASFGVEMAEGVDELEACKLVGKCVACVGEG